MYNRTAGMRERRSLRSRARIRSRRAEERDESRSIRAWASLAEESCLELSSRMWSVVSDRRNSSSSLWRVRMSASVSAISARNVSDFCLSERLSVFSFVFTILTFFFFQTPTQNKKEKRSTVDDVAKDRLGREKEAERRDAWTKKRTGPLRAFKKKRKNKRRRECRLKKRTMEKVKERIVWCGCPLVVFL